eukprot:CAMPEP_0182550006 /NCGR_PEP_ID=MMETSP1323-20130603/40987_1 /TAXON_ID=236787 /ORGANISM="Florenciella parvula, Strain RCC1693" /LENGTH=54 /DNA_ID=CAMNT_0024761503 /DNA_START=90 /DNA_END=251 /DNA_ORIENTATION=-
MDVSRPMAPFACLALRPATPVASRLLPSPPPSHLLAPWRRFVAGQVTATATNTT